ncbi:MAG: MFS transporter, partial [Candidatus Heimdallarchaeaceae archaeon]
MSLQEIALNPLRFRNIRTVFFANLILGLVSGFYNVILQPYIVQFIQSEKKLGLLLTSASIVQSLTLVLTAKVSDTRGRRIVYLSSLLLFIFAMLLYSQSTFFLMVVGALLLFSFAFGIREPAIQALTAESSQDKKTTSSFSFVSLAFYATGLIGPLIVRIFAGEIDLRLYFYGLLAGFIILYIFQLFSLRESLMLKNVEWNIRKDFVESLKSIFFIIKQFFVSFFYLISIPFYLLRRKKIVSINNIKHKFMRKFYSGLEHEVSLFSEIFRTPGVKYALAYFIFDAFIWGLSISIFSGSVILVYGFTEADIAMFTLVFNISTILFFIPVTLFSDKLRNNKILVLSQVVGSLFITMNIVAFFC